MQTLHIQDTQIIILPDPITGQQIIRIQATPLGAHIARALGSPTLTHGFYSLPHTPDLDERLCSIIDAFIGLRYAHPQLLQLVLFSQDNPEVQR